MSLDRLNGRRVIASISGGKDSAAMSLWLHEQGIEHDRVFLDTGWEHDDTYEYLRGELADKIGPITWISSPHKMVSTVLKKGMFPSRQRRFCTQELKVYPMQRYIAERVDAGDDVVNAVGIRAAESEARSKMPEWEWSEGFDCETWRPLLNWTEEQVIEIHRRHGLRPNPLYLRGATRVGCFPCIYARKAEIRLVAEIAPERIDLIARLEQRVGDAMADRAAARGEELDARPAWFQDPNPARVACRDCAGTKEVDGEPCKACKGRGTRRYGKPWSIHDVVYWSRQLRGPELFAAPAHEQGCMRWGLCETDKPPSEPAVGDMWTRLVERIRSAS